MSSSKKSMNQLVSVFNELGHKRSEMFCQIEDKDLKEAAEKLNQEAIIRQAMGSEDPYGDGDQSMLSGEKANILRYRWAGGGDYSPLENPSLSQWCKDCYIGNLKAIRQHLEKDPTLLERRESIIRLSGIFHVIAGAKDMIPPEQPLKPDFIADDAIVIDHLASAKYLIEKGANVHARDIGGHTPLQFATSGSSNKLSLDIAKLLLEAGADINTKNRMGCTPLFDPVMGAKFDCIDFLLENGADVDVKENDGVSLASMARYFPKMSSRFSDALAKKATKQKQEAKAAGTYGACGCCKKTIGTRRCSGCFMVWYCGVACQKEDWSNHKSYCKTVKKGYRKVKLSGAPIMADINFVEKKNKIFREKATTGENLAPNTNFIVKIQLPLNIDQTNNQGMLVYNKEKTVLGYIKPDWEYYSELANVIAEKGIGASSKGYFCALYHEKDGLKINISNIQLPQPW